MAADQDLTASVGTSTTEFVEVEGVRYLFFPRLLRPPENVRAHTFRTSDAHGPRIAITAEVMDVRGVAVTRSWTAPLSNGPQFLDEDA